MTKLISQTPVICLMGPTASGKTQLAVEIVKRFPCEIISVDSAMVYKGMDIGTAKPDHDTLQIAPHRLIDLLDPREPYSAGQFRSDCLREIDSIISQEKIPLLVGGTMLYFRVLQQGLATLPRADMTLRAELQARAEREGWEALHEYLASVDPNAAQRIKPQDSQRIQRALEVFLLTGRTISAWQAQDTNPLSGYQVCNLGLVPAERLHLHERITQRFDHMLQAGFIEEVRRLYARGDLTPDLPSIRSVGYRQAWDYLANKINYVEMREKAIIATRQLAKRQMTWLRSWPDMMLLDSESTHVFDQVAHRLKTLIASAS